MLAPRTSLRIFQIISSCHLNFHKKPFIIQRRVFTTQQSYTKTHNMATNQQTNINDDIKEKPEEIAMENVETENKQEGKRSAIDPDDHANKKLKIQEPDKTQTSNTDRVKRKKSAMLLVYSGAGYIGMQRNPDQNTIEEELLKALLASGLITPEMWKTTSKMEFQRAARTDKGVSAAGQVVSLKLPLDARDHITELNSLLPKDIRVIDIRKATKGFNSKNNCMSRTYSYVTPTYAFADLEDVVTDKYRISENTRNRVNQLLSLYKGTHNFHNFTSGKKSDDASAARYIIHFECGEPFIQDDMEFCTLKVKGQSFMLHQIRKMIGLVMSIVRGFASEKTMDMAWGPEKVDIPKAPGLGLLLDRVHYDVYNKRFGNDGMHEKLDWTEHEDEIEKFKHEYIYSNIVKIEKQEKSMLGWLATLPLHTYDTYREYRGQRETTLGVQAHRNLKEHRKQNEESEISSEDHEKISQEESTSRENISSQDSETDTETKISKDNSENSEIINSNVDIDIGVSELNEMTEKPSVQQAPTNKSV